MTDKRNAKIESVLLKSENEIYKIIRGLHKILDNVRSNHTLAQKEIERANRVADSLDK
jgi:hypothetical protein